MLVELVIVLAASVAAIWLLTQLFADALYLHRISTQHLDRMIVMDDLSAALRRDVWSATAALWEADANQLRIAPGRAGDAIVYRFEPERVVREVAGCECGSWQTSRLVFEVDLERGARGDVLLVSAVEAPPARARRTPVVHALSFALPRTADCSGRRVAEPEATP